MKKKEVLIIWHWVVALDGVVIAVPAFLASKDVDLAVDNGHA